MIQTSLICGQQKHVRKVNDTQFIQAIIILILEDPSHGNILLQHFQHILSQNVPSSHQNSKNILIKSFL